mgnify:FL=1
MGTKGSKNTPITARINTGLFNQKKGVKEPLLDVGPAGVYGNNQTKDIPSPSKMRGFAMKASPFKQKAELKDPVVTKSTKTDIEILDPVKTDVKRNKTYNDMRKEGASEETINEAKAYNADPANKGKKKDQVNSGKKTEKCPEGSKKVNGKCQKITVSKTQKTSLTKDKGDAQTSLDRRNTVRSGKHTARTKKAAQRKIDRNNRRTGAIDPSTIKKDKDGKVIKGSGKKYDKKSQRLKRQGQQAKDNLAVSTNENESVKRQSKQNISAKGNKNVKSKSRVVDSSDQSDANVTANANTYANKGGDKKVVKKKEDKKKKKKDNIGSDGSFTGAK